MKLAIYVPLPFFKGDIPEEAVELAKNTKLSIRIGEENDGIGATDICVIRIPENKRTDYLAIQNRNMVVPVDHTDEFETLPKDIVLAVSSSSETIDFKPAILEANQVRFRVRLKNPGKYSFVIVSRSIEKIHDSGEFQID